MARPVVGWPASVAARCGSNVEMVVRFVLRQARN